MFSWRFLLAPLISGSHYVLFESIRDWLEIRAVNCHMSANEFFPIEKRSPSCSTSLSWTKKQASGATRIALASRGPRHTKSALSHSHVKLRRLEWSQVAVPPTVAPTVGPFVHSWLRPFFCAIYGRFDQEDAPTNTPSPNPEAVAKKPHFLNSWN